VYLLFLDESGTHGGSPVFITAGIAVQEVDAHHLQQKLEVFLHHKLNPLGLNAQEFELHATELKGGREEWTVLDYPKRMSILNGTYRTLLEYQVMWPTFPLMFFGAAVDKAKVPDRREREKFAYELVLNKFDSFLQRVNRDNGGHQRGLVIHDQRVVHGGRRVYTDERAIQEWTRRWREAAERVGKLRYLADIPLFVDSQATRLIQAADFVAYALWRQYGIQTPDDTWLKEIAPRTYLDGDRKMHGLIHMSNDYAAGLCQCPPCQNRIALDQASVGAAPLTAMEGPAASA
jgi:hypothetical protein